HFIRNTCNFIALCIVTTLCARFYPSFLKLVYQARQYLQLTTTFPLFPRPCPLLCLLSWPSSSLSSPSKRVILIK
ncbi:hypothetical protein RhiirC2_858896, partial [Rhizophagus irregularis]